MCNRNEADSREPVWKKAERDFEDSREYYSWREKKGWECSPWCMEATVAFLEVPSLIVFWPHRPPYSSEQPVVGARNSE